MRSLERRATPDMVLLVVNRTTPVTWQRRLRQQPRRLENRPVLRLSTTANTIKPNT